MEKEKHHETSRNHQELGFICTNHQFFWVSSPSFSDQGTPGIAETFVCRTRFLVGTVEGPRLDGLLCVGNAEDGNGAERGWAWLWVAW